MVRCDFVWQCARMHARSRVFTPSIGKHMEIYANICLWYDFKYHDTVRHDLDWYVLRFHNTIRNDTELCDFIFHDTVRTGTIRKCIGWYDLKFSGTLSVV